MKMLIVKTSSLGDIIHVFPTLRYLRTKFPEAQIDWVVERPFAELVTAHPEVNRVLVVDTKVWRRHLFKAKTWEALGSFRQQLRATTYDLLLDLQGNIKSGLITSQAHATTKVGFGRKSCPERPNRWFTDQQFDPPLGRNIRSDYLYLAQSHFGDTVPFQDAGVSLRMSESQQLALDKVLAHPLLREGRPLLMVCPGSAWRNKQLPLHTLETMLQRLRDQLACTFLLIWGNQEEREMADALNRSLPGAALVIDRLPLPALQNLMGRMQGVIAMDSLPLHLAGTTSTPTFSVFGASLASKYRPEGELHLSIQGPCPYGRTFEKRCPILRTCPTGSCIRDLDVDTLCSYPNLFKINKLENK